jgi:WD40 repeat protein
LTFTPDGRRVITGDADQDVQVWDVETRTRAMLLSGHRGGVSHVSVSPDGAIILTGSRDGSARLWSATTGKPIGPTLSHSSPVARALFSHDGKNILTATQDQVTRSWAVPTEAAGSARELELRAQIATGMELEENGGIHILDAAEWRSRRKALNHAINSSDPNK